MKKYLNHILALIITLSGLSSCSDKDEPSPIPDEPEVNGYCLMMYISGGDMEHDLFSPRVSVRQPMLPVMMCRQLCCSKLPEKGKETNITVFADIPLRTES